MWASDLSTPNPSCNLDDWYNVNASCLINGIECVTEVIPGDPSTCTLPSPCGDPLTVTFTATDDCGNSEVTAAEFSVTDDSAPTLAIEPVDLTLECNDADPGFTPEWSDNCDTELALSAISGIIQLDCGYQIQRSWTATDDCGNSTTFSQTVEFTDTTAPLSPEAPSEENVQCASDISAPVSLTATDNCTGEITVSPSAIITPGDCDNQFTMVRTWTFIDDCGNISSVSQNINVYDNTPPVITCPEDVEINCGDSAEPSDTGMASATDNCNGLVAVDYLDSSELDVSGLLLITRTWTAIDICGNESVCTQMISTVDNIDPILFVIGIFTTQELEDSNAGGDVLPVDFTVECDNIPAPATLAAFDNCPCDEVDVTFTETETEGCEYVITRTWTATDCSGNIATHVQLINVVDTTDPVLSGLPDSELTINCQDEHPTLPLVTADDNCDMNVTVDFEEEYIGFQPDPNAYENCEGIQPLNASADWSMALFGLPGHEDGQAFYNTVFSQVSFYEDNGNGLEALLTGTVYDQSNPNGGWHMHIPLTAGIGWDAWSDIEGNSYKDDFNLAGNAYIDWTYYLVNSEGAYIEGWGDLEGSYLDISHTPIDNSIGWQHGIGANNVGPHLGLGGWMAFDGFYQNVSLDVSEEVQGAGDVAVDLNCCPTYLFTRTWNATDCAGNEASFSQEIVVLGTDAQEALFCAADFNYDGYRTTNDLAILLSDYGCFTGDCGCDLTGDGFTSSDDVGIFLSLYGIPCENSPE